jgi:hypothetical protein
VKPNERGLLLDMAGELLAAGQVDRLVSELTDAETAQDFWSDPQAVTGVFELQGAHLATSHLLNAAMVGPDRGLRVVLPVPGSRGVPGQVHGARIVVDGVVPAGEDDAPCVVATDSDDLLFIGGLRTDPVAGFDPALGLLRARGTVTLDDCLPAPAELNWDALVTRGARALAAELLGVGRGALEQAIRHVQDRQQFGRPIGAFQSVRHRLADVHIALEGAREVLDSTDASLDAALQVLVVKALAGRAALLAVQAAQQVCGAMGFTQEYGLHRYVRRAYLLDSLLGGSESAESELGAWALMRRRTPDRLVML